METGFDQCVDNDRHDIVQDGSTAQIFGEQRDVRGLEEGVVIICFHGSGSEAGPAWQALANRLAKTHVVVLFNRGSQNPSPAVHVEVVLQYLKTYRLNGSVLLVAHSYGGAFAKHFLFTRRDRVVGMVLVETGKGGLSGDSETTVLSRKWLDPAPLSVIRGNSFVSQWRDLEAKLVKVSTEQEENELDLRRKWLQMCDEEDEKLEKEQLKLSRNHHYSHLPHCGHNVIRDMPDKVLEEVQWVLENRQYRNSSWWSRNWIHGLLIMLNR